MLDAMAFRHKVMLVPLLALFGIACLLALTLTQNADATRAAQHLEHHGLPLLEAHREAERQVEALRRALQDAAAAMDTELLADSERVSQQLSEAIRAAAAEGADVGELQLAATDYSKVGTSFARASIQGNVVAEQAEQVVAAYRRAKHAAEAATRASERGLTEAFSRNAQRLSQQRTAALLLAGVVLLLLGWIAFVLVSRSLNALARVQAAIASAADGEGFTIDENERDPDMRRLFAAVARLSNYLDGAARIADRIATGEFRVEISPRSPRDRLGNAFATMAQGLAQTGLHVERLARGEAVHVVPRGEHDELLRMATAMNAYIAAVVTHTQAVALGDLGSDYGVRSADDRVGHALVDMTQALRRFVDIVEQATRQVEEASEGVAATTQQISTAASSQLEAAERGVLAVSRLKEEAQRLSAAAADLVGRTADVRGAGESLRNEMQAMATLANEGRQSFEESARGASSLRTVVQNVDAALTQLSTAQADMSGRISHVLQATVNTDELAQERGRSVEQLVSAIGQGGREMGRIVALIEDIVAQANLVALNASIVAAQAGGNGGGFAVVASEMKRLAQYAASNTAEIADVLQEQTQKTSHTEVEVNALIKDMLAALTQMREATSRMDEVDSVQRARVADVRAQMAHVSRVAVDVDRAVSSNATIAERVLSIVRGVDERSQRLLASASTMAKMTEVVRTASKAQDEVMETTLIALKDAQQLSRDQRTVASALTAASSRLQTARDNLRVGVGRFSRRR